MLLGYGVDLTVHELALRLVRAGHTVDVWTPTADDTYRTQPYALREFIVYGDNANRALPVFEWNANKALRALRQRLEVEGTHYDVLVPCTHPYYGVGRVFEVPQVFFNFGNVPHIGYTLKQRINYSWLDFSENTFHKPASQRVVSISHFLHDQQGLEIRQKGAVVHLGGDHYYPWAGGAVEDRTLLREVYPPADELRRETRERLGIRQDAIVVGYCGRLHRRHTAYKGTAEVLEVARRIKSLGLNVETVLAGVGSPDDEAWVREAGAIPWANVPPADMPGFYSAIDIYLSASRWEGFNLPIVEAGWHGVPAVAYEVGAHAEHVTAVLVHELMLDDLTRAVLTLVRDGRLRRTFAQQVQQKARGFSWDIAAGRFEQELKEAAAWNKR
jgi:glycosyltransferase involved in cell wall biosynthesis